MNEQKNKQTLSYKNNPAKRFSWQRAVRTSRLKLACAQEALATYPNTFICNIWETGQVGEGEEAEAFRGLSDRCAYLDKSGKEVSLMSSQVVDFVHGWAARKPAQRQ